MARPHAQNTNKAPEHVTQLIIFFSSSHSFYVNAPLLRHTTIHHNTPQLNTRQQPQPPTTTPTTTTTTATIHHEPHPPTTTPTIAHRPTFPCRFLPIPVFDFWIFVFKNFQIQFSFFQHRSQIRSLGRAVIGNDERERRREHGDHTRARESRRRHFAHLVDGRRRTERSQRKGYMYLRTSHRGMCMHLQPLALGPTRATPGSTSAGGRFKVL